MKLTRNKLSESIEMPNMFLADINQRIKYTIPSNFIHGLKIDTYLNNMDEASFKLYKYYQDTDGTSKEFEGYEYISQLNTIKIDGFGWFVLFNYDDNIDSKKNIYKQITLKSLEEELCHKKVYINNNSDDDTTTDNMYKIIDFTDEDHSCLHIALKDTVWNIGEVSANVSSSAHDFTSLFDSTDAYAFLTDYTSESFKCIFTFDTENKLVNCYAPSDKQISKDSNVYLSYNTIKSFTKKVDINTIVTQLEVSGGNDDYTGYGDLGIIDVNPAMNNTISNFSWCRQYFSDELKSAYDSYVSAYNSYKPNYTQNTILLNQYYVDLEKLNSYEAQDGVWSEYGLTQLTIESEASLAVISSYGAVGSSITLERKQIATTRYNAVIAEIEVRKKQITAKQAQIDSLIETMANNIPNIRNYISSDGLYKEFLRYCRKDEYSNTSIKTYSTDTMDDVVNAEQELFDMADEELEAVSQPSFELTIDVVNMLSMKIFDNYNEVIDNGVCCHVDYDENEAGRYHLYIRLLQTSYDFSSSTPSINFTFSNRNSLSQNFLFKELKDQAQSTATSLSYQMGNIKASAVTNKNFNSYINEDRNLMKNRIVSGDNQDIKMSQAGLLIRNKLTDSTYDPRQMLFGNSGWVLTQNSFNDISIGAGLIKCPDGSYAWGINAEVLVANLIVTSKMHIQNENSKLLIDENGYTMTNDINTIKMNVANDKSIFEISKGSNKVIWFDSSGNAFFSGKIEASDIVGGSINIGNNNFSVNNSGSVTCNDITVTGGSFNIGNKFIVNTLGEVTCYSLTATGGSISGTKITSTGGNGNITLENGSMTTTSASDLNTYVTFSAGGIASYASGGGSNLIDGSGIRTNIYMSYKGVEVATKNDLTNYTTYQQVSSIVSAYTTVGDVQTLISSAISNHISQYHSS